MPNSVVTSASRSLYNLREAEVGSTSNSSLAVPSKSVLTLSVATRPPPVMTESPFAPSRRYLLGRRVLAS